MGITAALKTVHFCDVIDADPVGVAVDKEHRGGGRLKLIGTQVASPRVGGDHALGDRGEDHVPGLALADLAAGGGSGSGRRKGMAVSGRVDEEHGLREIDALVEELKK